MVFVIRFSFSVHPVSHDGRNMARQQSSGYEDANIAGANDESGERSIKQLAGQRFTQGGTPLRY